MKYVGSGWHVSRKINSSYSHLFSICLHTFKWNFWTSDFGVITHHSQPFQKSSHIIWTKRADWWWVKGCDWRRHQSRFCMTDSGIIFCYISFDGTLNSQRCPFSWRNYLTPLKDDWTVATNFSVKPFFLDRGSPTDHQSFKVLIK